MGATFTCKPSYWKPKSKKPATKPELDLRWQFTFPSEGSFTTPPGVLGGIRKGRRPAPSGIETERKHTPEEANNSSLNLLNKCGNSTSNPKESRQLLWAKTIYPWRRLLCRSIVVNSATCLSCTEPFAILNFANVQLFHKRCQELVLYIQD